MDAMNMSIDELKRKVEEAKEIVSAKKIFLKWKSELKLHNYKDEFGCQPF